MSEQEGPSTDIEDRSLTTKENKDNNDIIHLILASTISHFPKVFQGSGGSAREGRSLVIVGIPSENSRSLVTRPKYPPPPHRETSAAIPVSHCISCGIADYRCYTPTSFKKNGYRNPKIGLTRGYRRKSLALKPIAL